MANMPLELQPGGLDEMVIEGRLETASTVSDAFGQFTFLGVPTGQYTLHALRVPRVGAAAASPAAATTRCRRRRCRSLRARSCRHAPTDPTLWARLPVCGRRRRTSTACRCC